MSNYPVVHPGYGRTCLREGPTKHERKHLIGKGLCPECRRVMRVWRVGPRLGKARCERCGGEEYPVRPGSDGWRAMVLEEERKR